MTWVQVESSDGEKRKSWIWLPTSKYRDLQYIGSGGFGDIYAATLSGIGSNNSVVALKKIPLEPRMLSNRLYGKFIAKLRNRKVSSLTLSTYEEAKNEVEMMKAVQGNNFILEYYDSFSMGSFYWIATELAKFGDLRDILQHSSILQFNDFDFEDSLPPPSQKSLPIDLIVFLMAPIFDAVRYLHSKGIIHRDIKEDNILITEQGTPKLCDFGTACQYKGVAIPYESGYVTTEEYTPPEIVNKKPYDEKVDVWALGVTMLSLHFCGWPFVYEFNDADSYCTHTYFSKGFVATNERFGKTAAVGSLFEMVRLAEYKNEHRYPKGEWKAFEDFLRRIIVFDSIDRPSIEELYKDEYLTKNLAHWTWNHGKHEVPSTEFCRMTEKVIDIAKEAGERKHED
eukprot:CAMPEP_0184019636 /NCGR_PEP_ID=MMETSP0954-20121128/8867_1 /TAXON_ID=627963 /ORGANISM="Aplanochytrium sp, Strain PBS07" /LENGTH=396 /DNA_ID=CAMNT_0026301335 /DNA_START=57 /DNA_END=1247 /DNA_ORIENTATION=-